MTSSRGRRLMRWAVWCAAAPCLAQAPAPVAAPPELALQPGRVIDPVACQAAADQTYALYLPAAYSPARKWPVLYAFDARRHGKLVADLYRAAAERFGWIIVSSNNSRSDEAVDPNIVAAKAMWEDSHARFAIDPQRVYATGHSGGARAACILAITRAGEVAGVIGHGGGFPFQWPPTKDVRFAFFGLAGSRDFNYPELTALDRKLGELGLEHHFQSFEGPHDWAPPAESMFSLAWMELLAMRRGTAVRRQPLIAELWDEFGARARHLADGGDPVAAAREYAAMLRSFAGLKDEAVLSAMRQSLAALEAAPETKRIRQAQEDADAAQAAYLVRAQARLRTILAGDPAEFDLGAAARDLEISRLRKEARAAPSAYERAAAERSLAALFGQTVFYIPTSLLERKDFARAVLVVQIATEIRPDDVDAWYASAAVRAQAGDAYGAVAALRKAARKGRLEARWLEADTRFDSLRQRRDFQSLLTELKAQPAAG